MGEDVERADQGHKPGVHRVTGQCTHSVLEIRRRTQSNGVVAYWRQCQLCFQTVGTALKHADVPDHGVVQAFDETARNRYWEERRQAAQQEWERRQHAWQQQRQERDREWWERYTDYLEGAEWQRKRTLVLARDQNRCQARMDGCQMWATQVHHLTYRHVFNEPLFDLVAVCTACHDQLHNQADE